MAAQPKLSPRFFAGLNLALILLVGFFVAHAQIRDFDLWWQLAAGRWIVAHHAVPRVDPFSFTSAGNAWIDLHWLFQLMVYAVYRLAGAEGLVWLQTFVFLAALALVLNYGFRSRSATAATVGGLVFILIAQINSMLRPHLLSIFFSVLVLNGLALHRRRRGREIYLLAPIMLVWVNCHSLFAVGLGLIASWGLGEFLDALRQGRLRAEIPYLVRLALASSLAAMVCLVNPYGVEGFLFPLTVFTRISGEIPLYRNHIIEFWPPFQIQAWSPPIFFYKVSLALLGLIFLLRFSKVRIAEVLAALCFGFLSYQAVRNLSLWAAVAGALLGRNLGEMIRQPRSWPRWAGRGSRLAVLVLSAILAAHAVIFAHSGLRQRVYGFYRFGAGFEPGLYPSRTADFLAQHQIAGQGFNCMEDGGFLLWRLFPARQVFFDGRLEVHEQAMFEIYLRAISDPRFLHLVLDRFRLQFALIRHDHPGLIADLAQDPAWAPVCLDETALLLVRRTPENQALIARAGLDWATLSPEQARSFAPAGKFRGDALEALAAFFQKVGRSDLTGALYAEAAQSGPGHARAEYFLGVQALAQGRPGEAKSRLESALPDLPDHRGLIHFWLAEIAEQAADPQDAIQHLTRAVAAEPDNCSWHERLGHDYLKVERPEKAEPELQKSLRCPDSASVKAKRWGALAVALSAQSKWAEAETAAFRALALDPTLQPARRLLEDLSKQERGTRGSSPAK